MSRCSGVGTTDRLGTSSSRLVESPSVGNGCSGGANHPCHLVRRARSTGIPRTRLACRLRAAPMLIATERSNEPVGALLDSIRRRGHRPSSAASQRGGALRRVRGLLAAGASEVVAARVSVALDLGAAEGPRGADLPGGLEGAAVDLHLSCGKAEEGALPAAARDGACWAHGGEHRPRRDPRPGHASADHRNPDWDAAEVERVATEELNTIVGSPVQDFLLVLTERATEKRSKKGSLVRRALPCRGGAAR